MKFVTLSAGRDRSIALASDGAAYGWGGVKRLGAQLPPGYPGDLCTSSPTEIGHNRYAQPQPQWLNPGLPFTALHDGHAHTLAVRAGGAVVACRPVVSPEHGADRLGVSGVPASAIRVAQTEAAAFALQADGTVWSWGMAAYGQLGRVVASRESGPQAIEGLGAVEHLAAGHAHVLALDRAGQVWAWGANAAGQLGNGGLKESAVPVRVALPARAVQVAAGDTHSFAVDAQGRLWAWGSNQYGQAGDGAARYFARPVRVRTGFAVAQVDAGMFYTVALSRQGDVFAWGWNGMGQLAQDSTAFSARPLRVQGLRGVLQLAAGTGHVLARTDTGLFAWGDNRSSACGAFPSVAVQARPHPIVFA
ncbi:RCC1 domain-containing protein [Paracidovorax valerianellae]|uniref:Regulator of chromosome condensation (RCC1) repeat-containing protein n=1 Tax=Paracidovorax valerianellae TaxID=187868 RepID=A0A1G6WJJ5_9BURK|nr:hypothetical protein [Paracidovorax valerianellae]MDA8447574.1 hypothetical protein [Paracidovorax valerianellae]SDD65949.1 Regulator of chromosome condensation (RCC1) repeat-containing protein [Paracidovorax valerianellae]